MSKLSYGAWLSQSHVGRILLLGLLIILLQIPIKSIQGLVYERQATQHAAIDEVQRKWGQEQRIIGPILIVPYREKRVWQDAHTGAKQSATDTKQAIFLPDDFKASSDLVKETRHRGIFEVPLYQSMVNLEGHFSKPDFQIWGIKDDDVIWDKARLVVMVSDARAIQKQAVIDWNGKDYYFAPGTDEVTSNYEGYHVDLAGLDRLKSKYTYSIKLHLNGSKGIYFAPLGKDSLVNISASWPDPSFQGKWLPTSRQINKDGFTSSWRIPYLGRNFPQQMKSYFSVQDNIQNSFVGVDLITPVDNYRMAERSTKYVLLFLLLTFIVIWLIEVLAKLRVHFLQYVFIGAGLCLFYLLELSLSEHFGFYWAYAIATTAIVSMVSAYSCVVLKTGKRAAVIGACLIGMYLYLFALLQEQNYALLIGSIGLFVMLGVVMYVTRNIDWFKLTQITVPKSEPAEQV
jgi:inner membrane protein